MLQTSLSRFYVLGMTMINEHHELLIIRQLRDTMLSSDEVRTMMKVK